MRNENTKLYVFIFYVVVDLECETWSFFIEFWVIDEIILEINRTVVKFK